MHHLIYIPREHIHGATTEGQLAAVGLDDHAVSAETRPCPGGPNGSGGTLYGWLRPGNPFHFNAAEQTWFPAAANGELAKGRYWVGIYNASPPTEQDLRRPGVLYGEDRVLGNGQPWHVPAPHFLPHDLMLADDGSLRFEPKRRYQSVCLEAARWRRLLAGDEQMVSYDALFRFCLLCLNLNYRLPAELASHLRLIDTESVKSVVLAACKTEEA